jgi:hypothetical protein
LLRRFAPRNDGQVVIASEATQSSRGLEGLDCSVDVFFAMTGGFSTFQMELLQPSED